MRLDSFRLSPVLLACLLTVACGRIGLDYLGDGDDDPRGGRSVDPPARAKDGGAGNDGTGKDSGTSEVGDSGAGTTDACVDGPLAADDATCDGVDDDCSGEADEDVPAMPTTCGEGVCAATGAVSCVDGVLTDSCSAGAPASATDGPAANELDDDCDGTIDEDACPTMPVLLGGTGLQDLAVPAGCTKVTVQLWGGGGASGDGSGGYWGSSVTGGRGGAGGFAQGSFMVSAASVIALRIGGGGRGCGGAGANADASYNGGAGATSRASNGTAGADGSEGGGGGAKPSTGGDGGNGFFGGGGGGGGGGPAWNPAGNGGGGGAASVLFVDGMRLLAGGGGGGGGAGSTLTSSGVSGGAGGPGCAGNGTSAGNEGGGGGGGGACSGTVMEQGMGHTPHVPSGVSLPAGTAVGGDSTADCRAGGDGFAIVQWAP